MDSRTLVFDSLKFGLKKFLGNIPFFFLLGFFLLLLIVLEAAAQENALKSLPIRKWAIFCALFLLNTSISAAMTKVSLHIIQGKDSLWRNILPDTWEFTQFFLGLLVYSLLIFAGLLLFVVPGLIWWARYGMYGFVIMDAGKDFRASLMQSSFLTKGSLRPLLALNIFLTAINVSGLYFFPILTLVSIPLTTLFLAKAYCLLSDKEKEGL